MAGCARSRRCCAGSTRSSSTGGGSRSASVTAPSPGRCRRRARPCRRSPMTAAYDQRMGELDEEQRHLEATTAAYEAAFRALTGRGRRSGIDDFANEALEAMRRERIRVYTEASGPLYFGRIDRVEGETLYVGRHAVWSAGNELLSVNWRAPAAVPLYTATEHDPPGPTRRRRVDIADAPAPRL